MAWSHFRVDIPQTPALNERRMVRREKSQPRRALGIGRNTSPPAHHTSFASQFRAVRTVLIFRACPHGSVNASLSGSNARPPPSTLTAHI